MAVNGKQKGNKYERIIANTLSARFSEYCGIDLPFRRNPDSGSFFGGTNIERAERYDTEFAIYGDLICPRKFKFAVECKNYKDAPKLNAIVNESVSEWNEWIAQAKQDAGAANKQVMLVIRYNRTSDIVFVEEDIIDKKPLIYYNKMKVFLFDTLLQEDNSFFFSE